MKLKMLIILMTFLFASICNAQTVDQKIKTALDSYKNLDDYRTLAGYPFCAEVIDRREEFKGEVISKVFAPLKDKMNKEFSDSLESWNSSYLSNITKESDISVDFEMISPAKDLKDRHYRLGADYITPPTISASGSSCFSGETQVLTLAKLDDFLWDMYEPLVVGSKWPKCESEAHAIPREIQDIQKGNYVLSSTVAIIAEKEFIKDCWAPVLEVMEHEPEDDNPPTIMTLEIYDQSFDYYYVKTTPNHNVYARVYLPDSDNSGPFGYAKEWAWTKACELKNAYLYSATGNLENSVTDMKVNWVNKSSEDIDLYNISVPTYAYYVGYDEAHRFLVHNLSK